MKEIKLTRGKVTLVDDWNYDWLNQWKWQAHKDKDGRLYAVRTEYTKIAPGKWSQQDIKMHRLIMKTPINLKVDHLNHDGLDNQEANLRNCTNQQNSFNSSPAGKSKYLGVSFSGCSRNYIYARISMNKKTIRLGRFKTEEDAARAYDAKAKELFGEFANLNFKEKDGDKFNSLRRAVSTGQA